ncbi:MAG: ribbon-helix-helix protein, CopG family [Kofleriaceae bacterium]
MLLQYGRGRPARGREVGPTTVRSLRLPDQLWDALDREAKLRETSTHALLRDLIAMFLQRR